ncbi:MAG: amidohydrolase family protein [Ignavibacteria bacterium]|nr:amidohydrolase family protein [Ignavibacteria bacterium]
MTILYLVLIFLFFSFSINAQIAVYGDTIYTMAGEKIINGVILIKDEKIEKVGLQNAITVPENYKKVKGKVVTPGLIDAHSVVGLSGIYNYAHDQDQLEKSDAIQPELRAFDAYNMSEKLVEFVRDLGVTTLHTGHGPGALASGQTMIVKTYGETLSDVIVDSVATVSFTLGSNVSRNYKKPGTRSKGVAMLREEFLKARDYLDKIKNAKEDKKPSRDIKLETLGKVLSREIPAMFTVQRATEIMTALRLQQEFGFKLILDGAAESYLLISEIKEANVSVILHPTMVRNYGDTKNVSLETAAVLNKEGITFALQSGYEGYVPKTRIVLFEAAVANANGLSFEDALATITIDAAKILGIENRVGSIEEGKDADLVLFDGNPFEYTSHVCTVIINGAIVKEECF